MLASTELLKLTLHALEVLRSRLFAGTTALELNCDVLYVLAIFFRLRANSTQLVAQLVTLRFQRRPFFRKALDDLQSLRVQTL